MVPSPDTRPAITWIVCLLISCCVAKAQLLKSVIYDFDGFDAGATDLPEGDYSYGDLSYKIAQNPLAASGVIGDRVLEVKLVWNNGYGAFGRGISRYLELDRNADNLIFYVYFPTTNQQPLMAEVCIADDDDGSESYDDFFDDLWTHTVQIQPQAGWRQIVVPLKNLIDGNSGGNGQFDIGWNTQKGMLLLIEWRFNKPATATVDATFYLDMPAISEGVWPGGSNPLVLPAKSATDYCRLGAHQQEAPGDYYLIPQHFEAMFPRAAHRKLKYVNTYMPWATGGAASPNQFPGQGYHTLISNGVTPIITWEPHFLGHSSQPNLSDIASGKYDTYLDAFADIIKTYADTIIVRPMHEFDGDWYPWCVSNNNADPTLFVQAFRRIVDRFRNKQVKNVLWMWSPNSDPVPQKPWNWIVDAYPGNEYVDIVATSVYNAHYPDPVPWWRSFRWQFTEVYYYFRKYFPSKQIMICELACRERMSSENTGSETKAGWFAALDRELQSTFSKVRGIVFFSENKTQTWAVNTSQAALQSITQHIWLDNYYFPVVTSVDELIASDVKLFPNPCGSVLTVFNHAPGHRQLIIYDCMGRAVQTEILDPNAETRISLNALATGVYVTTLTDNERKTVWTGKLLVQQ